MKTIWGAVLLAMMMLATAALAADLDTPKVGAAVCAPTPGFDRDAFHHDLNRDVVRFFQRML